ncbi:hypothetical protein CPB83DRAFT_893158 [Crepidotus variabilis]|uniref:Uncharacterized protein n=1 Tax=Crepidotus variabilis TaxID=179855 RepID=A0A9P6JR56_9AGAR|nr:hypothetical protein CPB83DRAFT_893158 [Crepidotus variabilis]
MWTSLPAGLSLTTPEETERIKLLIYQLPIQIRKFGQYSTRRVSSTFLRTLLWTLDIAAVEQIPWQHPSHNKAIKLFETILDFPNPRTISIENLEPWKEFTLWSDLSLLWFVLADQTEPHVINIPADSERETARRIRNLNFQGFTTQMTLAGVRDPSYLAIYQLRDLLEEDPDFDYPQFKDVGIHYNVRILPAEIWISECAKLVYQNSKENGEKASRNDARGGKHWKGKLGFSMGRWHFWQERLDMIASREEASEKHGLLQGK